MHWWIENTWICWGILPVLAAGVGYLLPVLCIEAYLPYGTSYMINHTKKQTRTEMIAKTQKRHPWSKQFYEGVMTVLGPVAFISGLLSALLAQSVLKLPTTNYPEPRDFILNLVLMEILGDFLLYCGHRVQHEFDFLWKFHSYHHAIDTPTPASTVYIHPIDSTLQGGLPILISNLVIQPHPLTFIAFAFSRVFQNTVNHSGMEHPVLNILCFRYLPGRASIRHHDLHHRFSSYPRNAKNYAEMFWVWDWLFGTMRT